MYFSRYGRFSIYRAAFHRLDWPGRVRFCWVDTRYNSLRAEFLFRDPGTPEYTQYFSSLSPSLKYTKLSLSLSTSLCAPTTQFLMSGGKSTKLKAFTHGHTQRTNREEAVASPSSSFGILFLLGPV